MALLPWHENIWKDLSSRHHEQGLPHALLFSGPSGIGKHQLAQKLAKWLLCQTPGDKACGQCHSCQLWEAGNHPDFLICQPEDNSRQIKIDTIRKLNHFIQQTPQISPCQVVILKPIEVMNINAANALLKTLEEPPGESLLLLETERFGSVLPTIRSRCQRINLSTPSVQESLAWLVEQGVESSQAELALQRNAGSPLKAKNWLELDLGAQHTEWFQLLGQWVQEQVTLGAVISALSKFEFKEVVGWLNDVGCDLLRLTSAGEQSMEFCQFGDSVKTLTEGCAIDKIKLIKYQQQVQSILGELLSGASHHNKTLTLEVLLIDWQSIMSRGGSPL